MRNKRKQSTDEILDRIMEDEKERILHIVDHKIKAYEHKRVDGLLERIKKLEQQVYEFEIQQNDKMAAIDIIWNNPIFKQFRSRQK